MRWALQILLAIRTLMLAATQAVSPARPPLAVASHRAAAGVYGATISGAGPTAVAIVDNPETGRKVGHMFVATALLWYGDCFVSVTQMCFGAVPDGGSLRHCATPFVSQ